MSEDRKLVIFRGLPGSGKSSLAKALQLEVRKETLGSTIHSTDNYFLRLVNEDKDEWVYKFDPSKLKQYHQMNVESAIHFMSSSSRWVGIDNTNTTFSEMLNYILAGLALGYEIEFLEPETEWKYDVEECFKRNTHGVPKENIQRMKDRWESTELCIYKLELLKEFIRDLKKVELPSELF